LKNIKNTNLFSKHITSVSRLIIQGMKVPYTPRVLGEVLASRKVVWSDPCTEGSGTAKAGTDEQKPDTRHGKLDEVAQHIDVPKQEAVVLVM
jgi:hypothetical protein